MAENRTIKFTDKYSDFYEVSVNSKRFKGLIKIQDYMYIINLYIPNYPAVGGLQHTIFHNAQMIEFKCSNPMENYSHVFDFMTDLTDYLENKTKQLQKEEITFIPIPKVLRHLKDLKGIIEENPEYKIEFGMDFQKIRIINECDQRKHFVEFRLVRPQLEYHVGDHSLPDLLNEYDSIVYYEKLLSRITSSSCTLKSIFQIFSRFQTEFCEFYRNLDILDELCYVVDPVDYNTSPKYNWRIIKMAPKVYAKIIVNPLIINSNDVAFFGPAHLVKPYSEKYQTYSQNWDYDINIYCNLSRAFEVISFPRRDPSEAINNCGICYEYRCNNTNQIPLIWCDNAKCNAQYHPSCLKKWYTMRTDDSKTAIEVTTGKCLNCTKKISINFNQISTI